MRAAAPMLALAVVALLPWRAPAQNRPEPLAGVIDFHCHSGPDALARSISDLEAARLARRAGLRGLVFKNHFTNTADRAELAMREVPGLEIFGGVVLNRALGGINPEAVRRMVEFEGGRGRVVWLPTFDAENHVRHSREQRPSVPVVVGGRPAPGLAEVFALAAEHGLVLATGHSSAEECLLLLAEAKKAGVKRLLVTHAMADPINATEAQMRAMARLGAVIECVWATHIAGEHATAPPLRTQTRVTVAEYARAIRAIGAEHFLVASDLGQYLNPVHPDGLRAFLAGLREAGISERELDVMARKNPARLLGLQ